MVWREGGRRRFCSSSTTTSTTRSSSSSSSGMQGEEDGTSGGESYIKAHLELNDEGLTIWTPFETMDLSHTQTRENCMCPACTVQNTGHRNAFLTVHQLIESPQAGSKPISMTEAMLDESGKFVLARWSDNHEGWINIEQVLSSSFSSQEQAENQAEKQAEEVEELEEESPVEWYANQHPLMCWKGEEMASTWQSYDFLDVLSSDKIALDVFHDLQMYGLVLIKNAFYEDCPSGQQSVVTTIGDRLSTHLYGTVFSPTTFTVEIKSNPENPAYTDRSLLGHTDLPYYEHTPEFFIFHCIKQACETGGHSFYVDGFRLAHEMRLHFADQFEALATVPVAFRDYQPSRWDIYSEKCILEGFRDPSFKTLRRVFFNEGVRCSLHWKQPAAVKRDMYEALKTFTQMVNNPDFHYHILMEPGDVQVFCNTRMLHGRLAFTGARKMEGAYFQRDAMLGRRRQIFREAQAMSFL